MDAAGFSFDDGGGAGVGPNGAAHADWERQMEQADQKQMQLHHFQWNVLREQVGCLAKEVAQARREMEAVRALERELGPQLRELRQGLQSEFRERTAMQERVDKRFSDHRELLTHEVARVSGESNARCIELRELVAETASREKAARDIHFSNVEETLAAERTAHETRTQGVLARLEAALREEVAQHAGSLRAEVASLQEAHSEHKGSLDGYLVVEKQAREEQRGALLTSLEALEALKDDMDMKAGHADLQDAIARHRGGAKEDEEEGRTGLRLSERVDTLESDVRRLWTAMGSHTHSFGPSPGAAVPASTVVAGRVARRDFTPTRSGAEAASVRTVPAMQTETHPSARVHSSQGTLTPPRGQGPSAGIRSAAPAFQMWPSSPHAIAKPPHAVQNLSNSLPALAAQWSYSSLPVPQSPAAL